MALDDSDQIREREKEEPEQYQIAKPPKFRKV